MLQYMPASRWRRFGGGTSMAIRRRGAHVQHAAWREIAASAEKGFRKARGRLPASIITGVWLAAYLPCSAQKWGHAQSFVD